MRFVRGVLHSLATWALLAVLTLAAVTAAVLAHQALLALGLG